MSKGRPRSSPASRCTPRISELLAADGSGRCPLAPSVCAFPLHRSCRSPLMAFKLRASASHSALRRLERLYLFLDFLPLIHELARKVVEHAGLGKGVRCCLLHSRARTTLWPMQSGSNQRRQGNDCRDDPQARDGKSITALLAVLNQSESFAHVFHDPLLRWSTGFAAPALRGRSWVNFMAPILVGQRARWNWRQAIRRKSNQQGGGEERAFPTAV